MVATIEPYLDFIVTLPGWPEHRVLRRLDAQGEVVSTHGLVGNASRNVDVTYTAGNLQALVDALLAGLSPVEIESLLVNFQPPRSRGQYLALRIASEARGRRKDLFELLYAIRYRATEPLIKLLQRDFPSLPYMVAKEIISFADSTELQRMTTAARIPLRLAEHAREYLQQLRINRALECLYLHMASPDSDIVSLDLINTLPAWPRDLVVEVRKNAFDGQTLYRSGGKDTTAADVNVVLVQTGTSYQSFDRHGQRTWFDSSRLRTTLSNTLSNQIQVTQSVHELENVLGDLATLQRSRVKRALGMQEIKPGIKWPSRSQDGRVGYRLSGRVRKLFSRFRSNAPAFSPELAVKALYPQFTSRQIKDFLQALAATCIGTPEDKKDWVRARLNELTEECATLESTLDGWVAEAVSPQPQHLAGVSVDGRRFARMRILSCWRREFDSLIDQTSPDSAHQLSLINLNIGPLPLMVANFKHVHALSLENIALTAEGAGAFVKCFPELRELSLSNNRIDSVPEVLGSLFRLQTLTLNHNPIRVDARAMQCLQRLRMLQTLLLEGRDINIAAVLNVSHWPALVDIRLRSCGLTSVPLGLGVHEPLRHVDLRHNQITEVDEPTLSAIAERPTLYVRLHHNPLNIETIASAATLFDEAALVRMGLVSLPPANRAHTIAQWLAETGGNPQHQHWLDLQGEAGAEPFVLLLEDLLQTADYRDNRRLLTERLWRMIDAMVASEALREELFTLAGHPQTCGDGTIIIFNTLDIRVLVSQLESLPGGKTPVDMFKLMRGLERLDELERIALEDFNSRVAIQPSLDQVEVRLIYPTRLRDELALPGQSQGMLFEGLSGVNESMLYKAKIRVLARESTPAFFQSLIARKDWMTFLEDHFQEDFAKVKQPFHDQQDVLDGQRETLTDDDYLSGVHAVFQALKRAVEAKAMQLTTDIALLALEPA
jgi:Leucine-rich repeat (LRR) protein